ncbi:MAG: GDSL-type esterase/lipase family protein [Thermoanaerobaculia bacterium]
MTAGSSRTGWPQRLGLALFGVLLLLLPEGLLRLAGYGGEPPLLLALSAEEVGPAAGLYEVNPAVAEPFFARPAEGSMVVGGHRREVLAVPAPANQLRVAFVGASTVEGFPLPGNVTAARFLEAALRSLLPERPVRVVNLGVTAVASFPVRALAARALDELDPDLLVVYTGHNELFGAAGVASWQRMGASVTAMRWVYALRRLALWQGLRSLLVRPRDDGRKPELVEVMAGVDAVEPGGALHERARRNLETNLREIAVRSRRHGVPVVLATVASNLHDLAPIGSWDRDLTPDQRLAAAGAEEASLDELERLATAAPRHAGVAYALARAVEPNDAGRASALFARARDLDSMPWRAPAAVSDVVRRVATEERADLADVEAAFAAAVDGPPGWNLFADHVHPNLEGQALLAATLLRAIAESRAVRGLTAEAVATVSWPALAQELGWNRLEALLLAREMTSFFRDGPLGRNNAGAVEHFEDQAAALEADLDPVERDAFERWSEVSDAAGRFVPISWFGGVAALQAGEAGRAAAAYFRRRRGGRVRQRRARRRTVSRGSLPGSPQPGSRGPPGSSGQRRPTARRQRLPADGRHPARPRRAPRQTGNAAGARAAKARASALLDVLPRPRAAAPRPAPGSPARRRAAP